MCGHATYTATQQSAANASAQTQRAPELLLAEAFKRDMGVVMDPQALRIFIRWRWDRISTLAHQIHGA
jgi:hypothetical protein